MRHHGAPRWAVSYWISAGVKQRGADKRRSRCALRSLHIKIMMAEGRCLTYDNAIIAGRERVSR